MRPGTRMVHLGPDVAAQNNARIVIQLEAQGILLPHIEQAEQHRLVQLGLGAEVIVHIAARQLRGLGDVGHGRAGEAFFGKDLFGRQKDVVNVALTNAELVLGHGRIRCD
ncbi:hypothetical protein D3C85_1471700 [compost metagenome]